MKLIKIFALVFVLFPQGASAALLTLDFESTYYFEQASGYDDNGVYTPGDYDYTSIFPTKFRLNYDINFELAPFESQFVDSANHKGWKEEWVSDGKRYSRFTSQFRADLLTPTTPFTDQLQSLMPEMDQSPHAQSSTVSGLTFFSVVASDLSTGEIIPEDSFEWFWLSNGFGFQNGIDDYFYKYELSAWLILPTTFTSKEANSYSVQEIKEMLTYRQDFKLDFNEVLAATTLAGVELARVGYLGNGTLAFDVPEPSTLAIFVLGIAGLLTRRFNKS